MLNGIRQRTIVKPGGTIEVSSSELTPGSLAEVIVILEEESKKNNRLFVDIIGSAKGCFKNPSEVDNFIHQERDRWI
jgi:hypothetical protein